MRLRYHFQYQNELRLFPEVHHHTMYGDELLGPSRSSSPDFVSINNLFTPNTVDLCFAHDGHGICLGKKDRNGNWNASAHRNRMIRYTEQELKVLSSAFEEGSDWRSVRLTSVHVNVIINVLEKFSKFPSHLKDFKPIITEGLNETTSVDKGLIKRATKEPKYERDELIYSGPHFFVGNPLYKTPRSVCVLNSDYDTIDLVGINESYIPRTNYTPVVEINDFETIINGFQIGQDENGSTIYDKWINYFKVGFRRPNARILAALRLLRLEIMIIWSSLAGLLHL